MDNIYLVSDQDTIGDGRTRLIFADSREEACSKYRSRWSSVATTLYTWQAITDIQPLRFELEVVPRQDIWKWA